MTKREKKRQWVTDRDRKRIAAKFPILVEIEDVRDYEKRDGLVGLIKVEADGPRFIVKQVKRFNPEVEAGASSKFRGFQVLARLDAVVQSEKEETELAIAGEAFRNLVEGLVPDAVVSAIRQSEKLDPNWASGWLSMAATANLDSARLVIWRPRTGTPGPAILCPNKETAAYASLALSRLFSGLRACLQCGVIFTPGRLDQDYDTRRCADLHRKRRQSAKERDGGKQR